MRAEVTVQPARGTAGSALRRSAPRINSVPGCNEEEHWQTRGEYCKFSTDSGGAPLPSSRKDAGERIEVGNDRGGAIRPHRRTHPSSLDRKKRKKAVRIQNERGTLKILVFRSQIEVPSIFQVRLRFISC